MTRTIRGLIRRSLVLAVVATAAVAGVISPAAHATQPGRNGSIAFAMDLGSGAQIYTIRPDGTGLTQLTSLDGNAGSPDWSPDGTRIAFGLEDQGLYVMNADGGGLHQIVASGGQPAYTPDGHHLVYECGDCAGGDGVFLMRDDGSDAPGLRLSTNPFTDEGDSNPEVAPDGQTVTFVRHQSEGELQALFAVGIDGTNTRQLTSYELEVGIKHDWAPNGARIVITPYADFPDHRSPDVATIAADGSGLRMLTRYTGGGAAAFAGSYAPDGRWIAFRLQNKARSGLWAIRPDGTERKLIAQLPGRPRFIDWGSGS